MRGKAPIQAIKKESKKWAISNAFEMGDFEWAITVG
jgi:hypothetical protein